MDWFPDPKKDTIDKLLFAMKEAEKNVIKKPTALSRIKERNFKFLHELGALFQILDDKAKVEEQLAQNVEGAIDKEETSLNDERLLNISQIYKGILLIGSQEIIEALLSERFV